MRMEKKAEQEKPVKLLLYLDGMTVSVRFSAEGESGLKEAVRNILIGSRRERVLQGRPEREEVGQAGKQIV